MQIIQQFFCSQTTHLTTTIHLLTMSPKQAILTDNAPKPLPGIYSQAIVANGTVYCSGSIGMDPATNKLIEGSVADRTVCYPPSTDIRLAN